jgi:hypothetical protein
MNTQQVSTGAVVIQAIRCVVSHDPRLIASGLVVTLVGLLFLISGGCVSGSRVRDTENSRSTKNSWVVFSGARRSPSYWLGDSRRAHEKGLERDQVAECNRTERSTADGLKRCSNNEVSASYC